MLKIRIEDPPKTHMKTLASTPHLSTSWVFSLTPHPSEPPPPPPGNQRRLLCQHGNVIHTFLLHPATNKDQDLSTWILTSAWRNAWKIPRGFRHYRFRDVNILILVANKLVEHSTFHVPNQPCTLECLFAFFYWVAKEQLPKCPCFSVILRGVLPEWCYPDFLLGMLKQMELHPKPWSNQSMFWYSIVIRITWHPLCENLNTAMPWVQLQSL